MASAIFASMNLCEKCILKPKWKRLSVGGRDTWCMILLLGCKGLPIKHHTVLITSIFFFYTKMFSFQSLIDILFVQLFPSSSFIPAFAFLFGRSYFITRRKIWFVTVNCSCGFYQFTKRFVNLWYQTTYFSLLYCKEYGSDTQRIIN